MAKTLRGGSFNLEFGRNKDTVRREVTRLLNKHDLDFLCVQEAKDYANVLDDIEGYDYFVDRTGRQGANQTGILVKRGRGKRFKALAYGDGWRTVDGNWHGPTYQAQVRVDWLIVRSLHLPTPSDWVGGNLRSPLERADDLIASMRGLKRFFSWPCRLVARCAAGDWNEPLATIGRYTPRWLCNVTGARGRSPESREGHGRIDYPVVKGAKIVRVFKDLDIAEGSDHEPVIFVLTKA